MRRKSTNYSLTHCLIRHRSNMFCYLFLLTVVISIHKEKHWHKCLENKCIWISSSGLKMRMLRGRILLVLLCFAALLIIYALYTIINRILNDKSEDTYYRKVYYEPTYRVIATMVIKLLDDCTHCVRSSFTHLGICRKLFDCSQHHFTYSQCLLKCSPLTFLSYLQPFDWKLKGDISTPQLVGLRGCGGLGMDPFDSLPMGILHLPLMHMVSFQPYYAWNLQRNFSIPIFEGQKLLVGLKQSHLIAHSSTY